MSANNKSKIWTLLLAWAGAILFIVPFHFFKAPHNLVAGLAFTIAVLSNSLDTDNKGRLR